jgi:hypothetical protein
LLAKGRFAEGSQILETLARINKKELPPSFKLRLKVLDFQHSGFDYDCKMGALTGFENNCIITWSQM